MKDPVRNVTLSLLDAGLAFSYTPFEAPAWFLEFEDDHEQRIFLDDTEKTLLLTSLVPESSLHEGEQERELHDGVRLERIGRREVIGLVTLPLTELEALRDSVYTLLGATLRLKAGEHAQAGQTRKTGAKKTAAKKTASKKTAAKKPAAKKK